jgi:plastocyanin
MSNVRGIGVLVAVGAAVAALVPAGASGAGGVPAEEQPASTNAAPVAAFSFAPKPARAGDTVAFDSNVTSDADGSIALYEWDLNGNGEYELAGSEDVLAQRTFDDPGTYSVGLRVTDDGGLSDTAIAEIVVEPAAKQESKLVARKSEKPQDPPTAKAAASESVTITDFKFTPATIDVNVGDTVTWTNDGPTAHSATADDGSFDTGILQTGESGSATFDTAGSFSYICTPHPFMKAKVVVADSGGGDTSGGDTSGDSSGDSTLDSSSGDSSGTGSSSSGSDQSLASTGLSTPTVAAIGLALLLAGFGLRRATVQR